MASLPIVQQTEQVLEWHLLIDALANKAASTMGADACRSLLFARDLQTARLQQQETTEMVQILEGPHPLTPLMFPDVRPSLIRATKEGLLEGPDLRDISLVLGLSQTTKLLLHRHRQTFPTIGARSTEFQEVLSLKQIIDYCIDEHGHLRETASPELHQLTKNCQDLRQTMRRRLEHLLASQEYRDLLQGQYFAERENRYVIPVKAERQHEIDGIVHDISGSGATVFVEPRHLIELNNSIKFADLQVKQEARRIFQDLSQAVAESVSIIQENIKALAELDCLMAKARLSLRMQGAPIHLESEPGIWLHEARHPLLVLTKEHVVANTIKIDGETNILVLSGPNAGGKTVTLKLVGLVALMAKVGLHPPCAPDSEIALFNWVYADIGDTQDLGKDLSSFSGHILKIIALLKDIQSRKNISSASSLVLLDEVGSSTDPIEGAALAEALLRGLCDLGCTIVATTHYPAIKTLAFRNSHVRNASHEFDIETLSPTYRLIDDLPGGSSALEIAGRLGLETSILQQAQMLIQTQDQDLDQVFRSLHETHARLETQLLQAQDQHQEAQRLFAEAQTIREQLHTQERDDRQRYRKQWQREFSKAQRYVNQILEDLKKEKNSSKAHSIHQALRTINQHMHEQLPSKVAGSIGTPKAGDPVEIDFLGTVGILQENPEGKKQVSILVGSQIIMTDPSALRLTEQSIKDYARGTRTRMKNQQSYGSKPTPTLGGLPG
ncbi:MAG: hypothetical protein V3U07_00445, partial [Nitrospirales bacterium]